MADLRPVFFFDIDNCLYSKSNTLLFCFHSAYRNHDTGKKVQALMGDLIDQYFMNHLSMSQEDANQLHARYYKDYGLAIEGLVRHHKVDALEYNSKVDDALPLETIIMPDPQLRSLLLDFDSSKVRLWLFTNAYITHGKRVVTLLGVDDLFEGITYCDYAAQIFVCKPHREMFVKAQGEAGVSSVEQCFFVDDSPLNCRAAQDLGWTTAHIVEPWEPLPTEQAARYQIRSLEELRHIFPQFFKSAIH